MWCVPELNDQYIENMEDVLETYERPYNPAEPVICLDEKPITLHAEVRPPSAAEPGREARRDSEYERRGTANVFCAVEPKAGRHFTFATPDRSAAQFAKVAFELAMEYPEAKTIHLVMDNLNIHRKKSLTDLLGEQVGGEVWDRFTVHYTPTHGSWLNQAEIEIGLFSRQCLGTRRIPDLKTLDREYAPGIGRSIAAAPPSTGNSTAKPPGDSSVTKGNRPDGHGTRWISRSTICDRPFRPLRTAATVARSLNPRGRTRIGSL